MLLSYSDGTVLFIFVPQITSSILCFLYFIVFVKKSFRLCWCDLCPFRDVQMSIEVFIEVE